MMSSQRTTGSNRSRSMASLILTRRRPVLVGIIYSSPRLIQPPASTRLCCAGALPFFAQPEMGSIRFRVGCKKIGRRPLPLAARVRPGAHSARHQDSRNDLTPCCVAWYFVSDGAHAPDSNQTLGSTSTPGAAHSVRRLRSLASLCPSLVHITQPAQHCGHATLRVRHPKGFLHPVGDHFGREVQVRLKVGLQFHQVLAGAWP